MASLSQLIPLTVRRALEVATKDIHFLNSHFSAFNLSHICRHCNKVIHSFAKINKKEGNSFPPLLVWMEDILPDIISVLQADLNNLF